MIVNLYDHNKNQAIYYVMDNGVYIIDKVTYDQFLKNILFKKDELLALKETQLFSKEIQLYEMIYYRLISVQVVL